MNTGETSLLCSYETVVDSFMAPCGMLELDPDAEGEDEGVALRNERNPSFAESITACRIESVDPVVVSGKEDK